MMPSLRIHVWGGFGSQLFAAYLILRLRESHPGRRFIVLSHSSGVTRRDLEFDFSSIGVPSILIEDFKEKNSSSQPISNKLGSFFLRKIKRVFLVLLKFTRVLSDANTESSFRRIKPWTLTTRGHYTNLFLEAKSVNRLFSAIFSSPEVLHERVSLTVHYRLGDLLTIKEKRPVEVSRIDSVLSKYFSPQGKFLVLTDSASEDFFEFVKSSPYFANCNPKRFAPVETLAACISSSIFIGSSAKISLWAAIFRQFQFSLPSYLPNELSWAGNNGLKAIWY